MGRYRQWTASALDCPHWLGNQSGGKKLLAFGHRPNGFDHPPPFIYGRGRVPEQKSAHTGAHMCSKTRMSAHTTHNSVRERVKNALSRTLLHLVIKIFKKKNLTFLKSAFLNNLRFFTNKCTHLLKTSNLGPQGPQNAALQQRCSPC